MTVTVLSHTWHSDTWISGVAGTAERKQFVTRKILKYAFKTIPVLCNKKIQHVQTLDLILKAQAQHVKGSIATKWMRF